MSILQGDVDDKDLESFLISLNKKGPTHQEVTGFVKAMRDHTSGYTAPKKQST